jgi:hypothetical protein
MGIQVFGVGQIHWPVTAERNPVGKMEVLPLFLAGRLCPPRCGQIGILAEDLERRSLENCLV